MSSVIAVICHAPAGESPLERLVESGRRAAAFDLIAKLCAANVDRIWLVTSSAGTEFEGLSSSIDIHSTGDRPFHFGDTLRHLIRESNAGGLLYFGSGSAPLLSVDHLRRLVGFARSEAPGALFNNFYSCDFAAISGVRTLLDFDLPSHDNPLGLALADAGLDCFSLPRSAETQFDIDTPTDLLVVALVHDCGQELRALLDRAHLSHPHLARVLELLADRAATLSLIGRMNPTTWGHFERAVACRTSGLIEGRGMRSADGGRTTLLHQVLVADGPRAFFDRLARSCDAAIIDTRPLLAEGTAVPPAQDRFSSDLFLPDTIRDTRWRAFTDAAMDASIPVVLGGHSLVSGGLYLLAEACWKGHDLPRRLHPDPFDWEKERP